MAQLLAGPMAGAEEARARPTLAAQYLAGPVQAKLHGGAAREHLGQMSCRAGPANDS